MRKTARLCGSAFLVGSILFSMSVWFANGSQHNGVTKVLLGPNKVPFCMPSQYVNGTGQLSDGSWRLDATMFLPDFLPEAVFDKLYPIPTSPIFQSPERVRYENSILQIEVTSSYIGPDDPSGENSLVQGTDNLEQFDFPSTNYPVEGFKEYDDRWGYPSLYIYKGPKPYGISCFGNSCSISEIFSHSVRIVISLNKPAIRKTLEIISKINGIIDATKRTQ